MTFDFLIGKRKLLSAGGSLSVVAYIASLVAEGGLTPPVGIALAAIAGGISVAHIIFQSKVDWRIAETMPSLQSDPFFGVDEDDLPPVPPYPDEDREPPVGSSAAPPE